MVVVVGELVIVAVLVSMVVVLVLALFLFHCKHVDTSTVGVVK